MPCCAGVVPVQFQDAVPRGQVVGEIKSIEQGMVFLVCESFDEHCALTLPADSGGGVRGNIFSP